MSYVKHLVSKKKKRFIEDGFDLDLAYIKPNIIAMGFPSENFEGVYRNNVDDVLRFLEQKHKDKYKVYNLCSERGYGPEKFSCRVSRFGFDDHNAPPFELMEQCCIDMDQWLISDPENVAIVHCKAGKGRTGVMICAYLLYKQMFETAKEAMDFYAESRTENKKGVTIPSQRRYIEYFSYFNKYLRLPRNEPRLVVDRKTVLLRSITFVGIPTFIAGTCSPSFVVYQTKVELHKSKHHEIKKTEKEYAMILSNPVPLCGDIKIDFFHKDIFHKERMFVFWFNTFFFERGVTSDHPEGGGSEFLGRDKNGDELRRLVLHKYELDKANKDKKHKFFPQSFKIYVNITVPGNWVNEAYNGPLKTNNQGNLDVMYRVSVDQTDTGEMQKRVGSLKRQPCSSPGMLQKGHSAPSSPSLKPSCTSPSTDLLNRSSSPSLDVITLEEEPLSDDDEDDDSTSWADITNSSLANITLK